MCRSKADGGQRCYSHAKARLTAATARHVTARRAAQAAFTDGASEQRLADLRTQAATARQARDRAEIELASTLRGRRELLAETEGLRPRTERWAKDRRTRLAAHVRLGLNLQNANTAARLAAQQPMTAEAGAADPQERLAQGAYDERARQTRAEAARLGHLVRVNTGPQPSDGSLPIHAASCSACGRIGGSKERRSAEMSANVHAGQVVDRTAAAMGA
jgi:hypothetical protein